MHDVAQSAAAPAGERDPLGNLVTFFETLSPHDLERIDQIYAADALFKDPFNEVRGHPAIRLYPICGLCVRLGVRRM